MARDIFRKEYKELTPEQKDLMNRVKEKAKELYDLYEEAAPEGERSDRARYINIGRTELEDSVMHVVKGITE